MNRTKRIRHTKNNYTPNRRHHKNKKNKSSKKYTKTINNSKKSKIVTFFLEMLNVIKLYHWKTKSYAEHKATDELHEKLKKWFNKLI